MARNEQLTLVIKAKNLFSKTFARARMGVKKLGVAAVRAARMGAVALAALAVGAIAAGRAILRFTLAQTRAEAKLAAVIRATGAAAGFTASELKKQARDLQALTGIGDETIINMQALALTFRNIRGDVFKEAISAALDLSVVLGKTGDKTADVNSSMLMLAKALNDPTTGMSALTRAGVGFTKAQIAQAKAMQQAGDIAGAQAIILAEVNAQNKGVASSTDKSAKAYDKLTASIGDAIEQFGLALIESSDAAGGMDTLREKVEKLAESGELTAWAQDISKSLRGILTPLNLALDGFARLTEFGIIARELMKLNPFAGNLDFGASVDTAEAREKMAAVDIRDAFDRALDIIDAEEKAHEKRLQAIRKRGKEVRAAREAEEKKNFAELTRIRELRESIDASADLSKSIEELKKLGDTAQAEAGKLTPLLDIIREWPTLTAGKSLEESIVNTFDAVEQSARANSLLVAKSVDRETAALERARDAADELADALQQKGVDPAGENIARLRESSKLFADMAREEAKRREPLEEQNKLIQKQRKRVLEVRKEFKKLKDDARKKLKIEIEIEGIDKQIAKLQKGIKRRLFLDVKDPRSERAAFKARKEDAGRIARETRQDKKRELALRNRLQDGRHIRKQSMDWLRDRRRFAGVGNMNKKAEAEIRGHEKTLEGLQTVANGYLQTIAEKLVKNLQAA